THARPPGPARQAVRAGAPAVTPPAYPSTAGRTGTAPQGARGTGRTGWTTRGRVRIAATGRAGGGGERPGRRPGPAGRRRLVGARGGGVRERGPPAAADRRGPVPGAGRRSGRP